MPALQTSYTENIRKAIAGAKGTMVDADVISRNVETATIGFGKAVEQGAADYGCKNFAGGAPLGITVLDRSAWDDGFHVGDSASILTKGDIWVVAAQAVVAGNPVYVRTSNGDFQKDNTNTGVLYPNARWETSGAAGSLQLIRIV